MAYKGGFFNAKAVGGGYAPTYNASDFSSFFSGFISNGVFPNATNSAMQVTPGNNEFSLSCSSGNLGQVTGYITYTNEYWGVI